jgi:hypothetical protein
MYFFRQNSVVAQVVESSLLASESDFANILHNIVKRDILKKTSIHDECFARNNAYLVSNMVWHGDGA